MLDNTAVSCDLMLLGSVVCRELSLHHYFRTANAPAGSSIGLYKTEVIRRRARWRHAEAVEFATLEWVDWFNNRRPLQAIGHVPPAECEQRYHQTHETLAMVARVE